MQHSTVRSDNNNEFTAVFESMTNSIYSEHTRAELLPKEKEEILSALSYMENLGDGWNGEHARKPLSLTINMAKSFIKLWPLNKTYPDTVSPDGSGGLTFKWEINSSNKEKLLLNFEPGLIHLAYSKEKVEPELIDNIIFLGEETAMPQRILQFIPVRKING